MAAAEAFRVSAARAVERFAVDAAVIVALTAIAAFLRFYELADFPFGLRGDEASVGIFMRTIREQGRIGPYMHELAGLPDRAGVRLRCSRTAGATTPLTTGLRGTPTATVCATASRRWRLGRR
jgi:hypothetical protein